MYRLPMRALAASTALCTLTFLSAPVSAQDAVVLPELLISASQVPITAREAGSAVTVITGQELEDQELTTAVDALRSQPGVSVSAAGGIRGGQTQVRIRGAEANHTLVLIDGVVANRAGTGEFDFASLLAVDIERIEIIRGPQSGIFGSNAHAGVVNIVTKSGRGIEGVELDARAEGGTQSSGLFSLGLRGSNGPVWGAATFAASGSEGFNVSRFGSERDGYDNLTGVVRGGVDFTEWLRMDGMLRFVSRSAQGDPADDTATFGPAPTSRSYPARSTE